MVLAAITLLGALGSIVAPNVLKQWTSGAPWPEGVHLSGGLGTEDGVIGDDPAEVGTDVPALTELRPALLAAVREAAADAAEDGVDLRVTSGWRSAQYQQHLLDEAVDEYGSYEEARRWVNTPDGSKHVTGDAVDVGPTDAADWLGRNGSAYGLCQVYANEMWHFELLTAPGGECPAMRLDGSS
ncbi:D-alanyl-D-alanine carboxypeptidase [Kineosporia sp. NBRC 101677]|nr:D-alanyl-D-alanine carboxypeptidase [Kineosporia sp. NBRC 101677]